MGIKPLFNRMNIRIIKHIVLLCILKAPSLLAQGTLKIQGELEYLNKPASKVPVKIKSVENNMIENIFSKEDGTFSVSLPLQNNYYLAIDDMPYDAEKIFIEAKSDYIPTDTKLWPVYIKIKLTTDGKTQKYESKIYYDTLLHRFDYFVSNRPFQANKKIFSGYEVVSENTTISLEPLNSIHENKIQVKDDDEKKFELEISNMYSKSARSKEILEEVNILKHKNNIAVKKEHMQTEQFLERIERDKQRKILETEMQKTRQHEAEIENKNALLRAEEKRRFIEEIAETKKLQKELFYNQKNNF